jgi:hypothetical protein
MVVGALSESDTVLSDGEMPLFLPTWCTVASSDKRWNALHRKGTIALAAYTKKCFLLFFGLSSWMKSKGCFSAKSVDIITMAA